VAPDAPVAAAPAAPPLAGLADAPVGSADDVRVPAVPAVAPSPADSALESVPEPAPVVPAVDEASAVTDPAPVADAPVSSPPESDAQAAPAIPPSAPVEDAAPQAGSTTGAAPAAQDAPAADPVPSPGAAPDAPTAAPDDALPADAGTAPDLPAPETPAAPAEDPVTPVPAQVLPPSEPTLPLGPAQPGLAPAPRAPHTPRGPRVMSLPGEGSGGTVRRRAGVVAVAEPRTVEGVTIGRLPSIGAPVATPGDATASDAIAAAAAAPASDAEADPARPAWQRNGVTVDLPQGARALGVVLLDDARAELDVMALPFAVTVALDPYDPDAPRRAAGYRNAGHEVALLASALPVGATPADIAVTLESWRHAFPDTAELMDVPVNGVGSNRALARTLAEMAAPEGYGLIVQRDGVDALFQAARANSMAVVPDYRVLDDTGQGAMTLRRLLDRAAFEAQRRNGILIVGSAGQAETLAALSSYAQGAGREGVVLAPASAVLETP